MLNFILTNAIISFQHIYRSSVYNLKNVLASYKYLLIQIRNNKVAEKIKKRTANKAATAPMERI